MRVCDSVQNLSPFHGKHGSGGNVGGRPQAYLPAVPSRLAGVPAAYGVQGVNRKTHQSLGKFHLELLA